MRMKGLFFILALMVWVFGTIGSFGYLCYIKEYPCAIAALGNGVLAFFTVKKLWKKADE
jgi:TM2 domain-containing membrane protein YozV